MASEDDLGTPSITQSPEMHPLPFPVECDPYDPYQFFLKNFMSQPWQISQHFVSGWYDAQRNFLMGLWDWASYQQWALQKTLVEDSYFLFHCLKITSEPNTLFRYLKMHWKNPLQDAAATAFTSTRYLSHMWVNSWSAWHKAWLEDQYSKAA
ncbi:MAG: hypothetical protein ACHQJ6_03300 [Candidatus Berkiellales bacterium]